MHFRSCVHVHVLPMHVFYILHRIGRDAQNTYQEFWSLLSPTLMSEEEDGEGSATICRRRPSRRSLELNDLTDYLDRRASGLVLFIEASKEAACFGLSGVTAYS